MWDYVFGWSVVATVGPGIVLLGFGVLSMTPAEYKVALWCFAFGYIILLVKIASWILFERTEPTWGRALFVAFVFAVTGISWFASSLFALSKKERCLESVLVIQARMDGAFGPKATSTQIALDIANSSEDAVQNMDLTIARISKMNITGVSEVPAGKDDCKSEPVNLFPETGVTFKGADGDSRLTLSTREASDENIRLFGSRQWKLRCQRFSGRTSMRFLVTVAGDAEKDSIQVSGTYECIPSKGSAVVKVNSTISLAKRVGQK